MTTVYNWEISEMDQMPQDGSLLNVVKTVRWLRNATTEIDGKTYVADVFGTLACATPSETDFTAYADLTFEQVCSWLNIGVDVPALNAELDFKLSNLINPPTVNSPLPWQSESLLD